MPTTNNSIAALSPRTFGAEIEFVGISREAAARALNAVGIPCEVQNYNHTTARIWKVVTDASVTGGGELVSPPLSGYAGIRELRLVMRAMVAAGAQINRSCGFHVHVDARDLDDGAWKRLVILHDRMDTEWNLRSVLAPSRRDRNSGWAKRTPAHVIETAKNANTTRDGLITADFDRYVGLNLQAYRRTGATVEFRHHQGTLCADKATAWVVLCLRTVETAKVGEGAAFRSQRRASRGSDEGRFKALLVAIGLKAYSRDGFATVCPLCKWAGSYLLARRAHFAGETVPRIRGNAASALDACLAEVAA